MDRQRHVTTESKIDHLALSRAQHFQSRDDRRKSLSDDEENRVSDWSDSDRECSPLSDVEWSSNDLVTEISHFDLSRPNGNVCVTPVPIVTDSTTSTRISFNNELERPKTQYVKKSQIPTRKIVPPPLLPGRRTTNKMGATRRPSIRSTTTSHSSFSTRFTKTPVNNPSRLSPNSSIHSHEKSLCDDLAHQRRNLSPNLSQISAPRLYEVKKFFVDESDYGRLTETNSSTTKHFQRRNRQKWGTIVHPPFPLGYQHIAPEQVNQVVERLASPIRCRDRHTNVQSPSKRYLSVEETEALINRLSKVKTVRSPDQYWSMPRPSRTVKNSTSNWKTVGIPA